MTLRRCTRTMWPVCAIADPFGRSDRCDRTGTCTGRPAKNFGPGYQHETHPANGLFADKTSQTGLPPTAGSRVGAGTVGQQLFNLVGQPPARSPEAFRMHADHAVRVNLTRYVCAAARMEVSELSNIRRCMSDPSSAIFIGRLADASPMTAYQGFKAFSYVVLGLMSAGVGYAAYIAVTYWTGISV